MHPIELPELSADELAALDALYHSTRDVRLRMRVHIVLLAAEQRFVAPQIAASVRIAEETVRRWLNPIEMLWRHFRREVTHCKLFETMAALVSASYDFFARYNQTPERVLSIIGAHPT